VTPEQQANEWLAIVKDRAMTRAKAEAAGAGTQFSADQLELVGIGILAGASEMLPNSASSVFDCVRPRLVLPDAPDPGRAALV
jgi:hypothetical protein